MIKKWMKAIGWLLLTPIILITVLAALLYLPPIQRWAVDQATGYAARELDMEITLERVRLSFPLDLELQGLEVKQQDTRIAALESLLVDLDLMRILRMEVRIEAVELKGIAVDTGELIESVRINGSLDRLLLKAEQIDLLESHVSAVQAAVEGGDVEICLADTTAADTTASDTLPWKIGLESVSLDGVNLRLRMPLDTIDISAQIRRAELLDSHIDLYEGFYSAQEFMLQTDTLRFDSGTDSVAGPGMDFAHLLLSRAALKADNVMFNQHSGAVGANLGLYDLHERSGLTIEELTARLGMDSTTVWADSLALISPHSHIAAQARMDLSALNPQEGGGIRLALNGSLGSADLKSIIASMLPPKELKALPDQPLQMRVDVDGTTDTLEIRECRLEIPTVLKAGAEGTVRGVMDWNTAGAELKLEAQTHNLSSVKKLLEIKGVELPAMRLSARMNKLGALYRGEAVLKEGEGSIHMKGRIDTEQMNYKASARIEDFPVDHFLPADSIFALTAEARIEGRGIDFMSPKTQMNAEVALDHIGFKKWILSNAGLTASLNKGTGVIDFHSDNELLKIHACAEALVDRKISQANFNLNLNYIDLYALNLSRDTLAASMVLKMDGTTDFKENHRLDGSIQAMELMMRDTVYHPLDLGMKLLLETDSIYVDARAGDLLLSVNSSQGLKEVLQKTSAVIEEAKRQRSNYYIDQDTLRTLLPHLQFHLHSGKRNPMHNILHYTTGYTYNDLLLEVNAEPGTGLKGGGHVYSMHTGSFPVDTIRWTIFQDSTGVNMRGRVSNNRRNKVANFESNFFADITPTGIAAGMEYLDAQRRKGIEIGLKADALEEGFRVSFMPEKPVIAYRNFTLNKDNFIMLNRNKRVEALVDLLADDGTGLKLYSTPNEDAVQDISMELNRINLGELSTVLPYLPAMDGLLQGDLHYLQSDSTLSVSVDSHIQDFKYSGSPIGNVGLNAVYLPNSDGTHYVDAVVTHDDNEALLFTGEYHNAEGEEYIDALATLSHLPLRLANGFIPDKMAELDGFARGELKITGSPDAPTLEGAFLTDGMKVKSVPYSLNLTFPNDTIRIKRNIIDLDRIEAYAVGDNPLVLDGTIDLMDKDGIRVDLAVQAKNYQLINASKTRDAQAYGKVFVDIGAIMRGTLNDLRLRGRLTVLGRTDVTYVLKDSPISTEDQLSSLVEFVDMQDTVAVKQKVMMASPQKMDMLFTVNIEQAAQVHCLLSESGSDYVNLEGGGELTLSYDTQENMRLTGRYTIIEGDMKYTLMELVSKHFTIHPNSYVEFHGNMMNPSLHIRASERVKSTVTENNVPRSVNFDVGLQLSRSLADMGLEFTLEAPEDMSIQNELAAMSPEQRGRVAVTMLATGIYLTDNYKAAGVSSGNALYNYLQGQIGAIAGKALKTVDVNFGIDNTINQAGISQTDYNFSFAKRFWGNRIRVIIGGKVSTGENVVNNGQTIIDNVSLEYRLDNSATRYVKLYYDKNYESLLEGELTEMGAGAVFRRKSAKLGDLFIFRKKKEKE